MLKTTIIIISVIVIIFVILLVIGKKQVRAEVTIKASPQQVWQVLTDISRVKEWNQVLIPIEGQLTEGTKIKYEFYQDEGGKASVMSAEVYKLTTNELINQKGGIPLILTFNHQYILEQTKEGTKVTIQEEYRGAMVPFWNPAPVEQAYERLLISLKERAQQLNQ